LLRRRHAAAIANALYGPDDDGRMRSARDARGGPFCIAAGQGAFVLKTP
jgi:hypothetical protein